MRNKPYSSAYTPEEIEALPATEMVFNQDALDFHKHTWTQEGYELVTEINGNRIGVPIPFGKMLIKGPKGYELVDELRENLDTKRAAPALQKKETDAAELAFNERKANKAKKKQSD